MQKTTNSHKKFKKLLISAAILLGIVALSFLAIPIADTNCFIQAVTGMPCPGCGMTRAYLSFLQFDFTSAFYYHPLFLLVIVTAVLLIIGFFKPKFEKTKIFNIIISIIITAFLVCYVIRMIIYFPHTEPMDYNTRSLFGRLLKWIGVL